MYDLSVLDECVIYREKQGDGWPTRISSQIHFMGKGCWPRVCAKMAILIFVGFVLEGDR